VNTVFWLGNLKGRKYLEDQGVGGKTILEWILGKGGKVCTGCIWLKVGTIKRLL